MKTFMLIAMLVGLPMQAQTGVFSDGNKLISDMREWEKATAGQSEFKTSKAAFY